MTQTYLTEEELHKIRTLVGAGLNVPPSLVEHLLAERDEWIARANAPEVEVTHSGSSKRVEAQERPVPAHRSGAKNVAAPHLQNAFIGEARASMGQPTKAQAEDLVGQMVVLHFNVDWSPATGKLTEVIDAAGGPYLLLDDYRERAYPLNAIQSIEVIS